jgi:uncharacterized membrane protein YcaP (DUF421 family)
MFNLAVPPWELVVRSISIYIGLLLALRLFGKREIGQFTLYDLVLVLLVANAVQPAMTGPDSSLLGGLVIIASLILLNFVVGRLDNSRFFRGVFQPLPSVIIQDGRYVTDQLRRQGVDRDEADMAIREHGLDNVSEVRLGVLEADGSISIVPNSADVTRTRRRVRYQRRG